MEKGGVFVRFSFVILLLSVFTLFVWMSVRAISGTAETNGPAKLASTPVATSLAPTPWTTPLVSDFVLGQEDRVGLEATKAAVQASLDRVNAEIWQADESRKLFLLRQQQEYELEGDRIANRLLELAAQEQEARVTAEAQWLANKVELDARGTRIAQDAEGIILNSNARATEQAQIIAIDLAETEAKEAEADAILYYSLVVFLVVLGVIGLGIVAALAYIAIYPNLSRVKLEERGRTQLGLNRNEEVRLVTDGFHRGERRTADTPIIVPSPTGVGEVVAPPNHAPSRQRPSSPPTSGHSPITDLSVTGTDPITAPSETVTDAITDENQPLLAVKRITEYTDAEKQRILEAFHRHGARPTPAARQLFGDASGARLILIRAIVAEAEGGSATTTQGIGEV